MIDFRNFLLVEFFQPVNKTWYFGSTFSAERDNLTGQREYYSNSSFFSVLQISKEIHVRAYFLGYMQILNWGSTLPQCTPSPHPPGRIGLSNSRGEQFNIVTTGSTATGLLELLLPWQFYLTCDLFFGLL